MYGESLKYTLQALLVWSLLPKCCLCLSLSELAATSVGFCLEEDECFRVDSVPVELYKHLHTKWCLKRTESSMLVGIGYGRPWIDQWRPGPKTNLSLSNIALSQGEVAATAVTPTELVVFCTGHSMSSAGNTPCRPCLCGQSLPSVAFVSV